MIQMSNKGLFCEIPQERIILNNKLSYAIRDAFPVTELHTLVIPKRHTADYFELDKDELLTCNEMLLQLKQDILKQDKSVTGFNVGINIGADAGQTIFHCHIHLIPRRLGDVPNPKGGIRHLIPGKGCYIV